MASKKPPIKNQILADYLISSSHDLKSIGGLVVSGIISTFGMYSIVLPFFSTGEEVNTSTLNTALFSFVGGKNDNIQEHETILAEHEQQTAEMMANSKREKNVQDRKFQEVGEAISITHKKKNVEVRGKTVRRIANNQYVNTESAKTGFVYTGEKNQDVNESVNDEASQDEVRHDEDGQDGEKKQVNMNEFEFLHRNMIALLFKGFTINRHDRLRTRDEVVKTLHEQGHGQIRDLK